MKTRYEVFVKIKDYEGLFKGDTNGIKYKTKEEALASITWDKRIIEKVYIRRVDIYEMEEVNV